MQVTREELAWAAGFFDGEGSVGVYGAGSTMVSITNTHHLTVLWFRDHFGGSIRPLLRSCLTQKPAWQWTLTGPVARRWLSTVLPWLHEKAAQAEIARGMVFGPGRRRFTMEYRWQRDLEIAELRRLKRVRS